MEWQDNEAIKRPEVLVIGLRGLGAEIAKNLIVDGFNVSLCDDDRVQKWDLSGNFLLSESEIGTSFDEKRGSVCHEKLQTLQLKKGVMMQLLPLQGILDTVTDYNVVVYTGDDLQFAILVNEMCHAQQVAFIKANVNGLFGSIFCDLGSTVDDVGEQGFIESITKGQQTKIGFVAFRNHKLKDGNMVVFEGINGMAQLNDGMPRRIYNCTDNSFIIHEDTRNFDEYVDGGLIRRLDFKTLGQQLQNPKRFMLHDNLKVDQPRLLHLAYRTLDKFMRKNKGRYPEASCKKDIQSFISLARGINKGFVELNQKNYKVLEMFAYGARSVIGPMATLFGGIVCQEVVKACSKKFYPIFQFFYFDSIESLPKETIDDDQRMGVKCRYDAQIAVFGQEFQSKLLNTRAFLVGSGAIGQEYLKLFALMGVGCGVKSCDITVADKDCISEKDLNGQWMFYEMNIGKSKPIFAAVKAKTINTNLNVQVHQETFEDSDLLNTSCFWENKHFVVVDEESTVSKLDVAKRCMRFKKPFLECGTLGTCFNTQVVIPDVTQDYRPKTMAETKPFGYAGIAIATGLACLEIYKIVAGHDKVEVYRNTFGNMALPPMTTLQPSAPKVCKHNDFYWTCWDRHDYEGDPTVNEFISWIWNKTKLIPCKISYQDHVLYHASHTAYDKDPFWQGKRVVSDLAKEMAVPPDTSKIDVIVYLAKEKDTPPGTSTIEVSEKQNVYEVPFIATIKFLQQ